MTQEIHGGMEIPISVSGQEFWARDDVSVQPRDPGFDIRTGHVPHTESVHHCVDVGKDVTPLLQYDRLRVAFPMIEDGINLSPSDLELDPALARDMYEFDRPQDWPTSMGTYLDSSPTEFKWGDEIFDSTLCWQEMHVDAPPYVRVPNECDRSDDRNELHVPALTINDTNGIWLLPLNRRDQPMICRPFWNLEGVLFEMT